MFKPHSSLPPIVHPVNPRDYHDAPAAPRGDAARTMSQSELKEFSRCQHRWLAGFKEESSDAMNDGALLDTLILTPERFESVYAVAPDTYPAPESARKDAPIIQKAWNWNAEFCKNFRTAEHAAGREVVKSSDHGDALKAREILFLNEHIAAFHSVSRKQVQVNAEWHDEETGIVVPIKCLLDLAPDPTSEFGNTLADFKRTQSAEYRAWTKTVRNFGLHYQAAFYIDAINAAAGLAYRSFEHHIQESFEPWETTHRMLSDDFITLGRVAYIRDLKDYCRALKTGTFRGYDEAIVEPESWMAE